MIHLPPFLTLQSTSLHSLESISGEAIVAETFRAAGDVDAGGVGVAAAISSQAFIDVIAIETLASETRQALASEPAWVKACVS